MQQITRESFVNMLRNMKKSASGNPLPLIMSFTTTTEPKMVKKHRETKEPNPFLGIVKKHSYIVGIINFRYASAVNKQRVREANPQTEQDFAEVPEFTALPRTWGEHIPNTPLIEHTNTEGEYNLYLEIMLDRSIQHSYTVNDQPATREQLTAMKEYFSEKNNEGARQEVEKVIIVRDYKISSINGFKLNGEEYQITN